MVADLVVGEAEDKEEDGEHDEAGELERLPTNSIDGGNSQPVTWDGTGANQDTVTSGEVVQLVIDSLATSIADGCKDSGGVQSQTVKGNLAFMLVGIYHSRK